MAVPQREYFLFCFCVKWTSTLSTQVIRNGRRTHQKTTNERKMCPTGRGWKGLRAAATLPGVLREKRQPQCWVSPRGRWRGDTGWLREIVWPAVAFLSSFSCLEGSTLSSVRWYEKTFFTVCSYPEREAMSLPGNHQPIKDRVVSSSWVISGLCYELIGILRSKGMSSG